MKVPKRMYKAPNDKQYPLYEAPYPMPVTVYKSDARKATIGDPSDCLIARGLKRMKNVEDVFVGSTNDAYVCFRATKLRPAHALHFTINAQAGRVRDFFDTHKNADTQALQLDPPSAGRTLEHRSKLAKRRREEIKNGATTTKHEKPYVTRIMRLGVHRRPKAVITKGLVTAPHTKPKPEPAAQPQQQSQSHQHEHEHHHHQETT